MKKSQTVLEKVRLLRDLKSNPLSDLNTINRLQKELEWVDVNTIREAKRQLSANPSSTDM